MINLISTQGALRSRDKQWHKYNHPHEESQRPHCATVLLPAPQATPQHPPGSSPGCPSQPPAPWNMVHPELWGSGISPGLSTNWGVTAWGCGTLHGVQGVAQESLWDLKGMHQKQEGWESGQAWEEQAWENCGEWGYRGSEMCKQATVLMGHLIDMIHPIFSLLFSGQGALFCIAVGGDCGSGSMHQPCSQYSYLCLYVITSKCAAQVQAADPSEGDAHGWCGF